MFSQSDNQAGSNHVHLQLSHPRKRPRRVTIFRQRLHKSFVIRQVTDHEQRLLAIGKGLLKELKNLQKKVTGLEDEIDKLGFRTSRLMRVGRRTEKSLRSNGLLRDGEFLSRSSSSELE